MNLLTIQTGHNATVCIMQEGEITGLLSQEKIDNVKNSSSFPTGAISAILTETGLTAAEIDHVVIATNMLVPQHCISLEQCHLVTDHMNGSLIVRVGKKINASWVGGVFSTFFKLARNKLHEKLRNEAIGLLKIRLSELGLDGKPVSFVDHHLCHARAAYHSLEIQEGADALVFTLDGMGDGLSATVTKVTSDGKWERIAETPISSSLGSIYSETTRFLGMKVLEHEYKVMGLAAYCKKYHLDTYNRVFKGVIDLDPLNNLRFKSKIDTTSFYQYLINNAVGERFDNIAGSVQYLLEDCVTRWIRSAVKQTGISRVFTGGGAFMNVKLNKCIQEMPEVSQAWFLPSCGDESNPIGAAYAKAIELDIKVKPLRNIYLGVSYGKSEVLDFILKNGLQDKYTVNEAEDIEEDIAELLARRQVVARFSGRCEWGARSLGNRAILAHPSYLESFYTVNDLIKVRDFWMPFAPTVLDEWAFRYLENYEPSKVSAPHMITAFRATELGVKHLRAAMHQGDFTIRPQVLVENANPDYYRMIKLFESKSGVGGVMNTSFNLHGYPLVASPEQALMTFENSGLKYLALGSYLISKD